MAPPSFKILFTIRGFYTRESLSNHTTFRPIYIIWCDAAFKASLIRPECTVTARHAEYNKIGRLRYLRWSYGTPLYFYIPYLYGKNLT
jgi:hypothetical protein